MVQAQKASLRLRRVSSAEPSAGGREARVDSIPEKARQIILRSFCVAFLRSRPQARKGRTFLRVQILFFLNPL